MIKDWQIKGFIETSLVDWPGRICSVIFLPNCNFRCPICHNHGLVLNTEASTTYPTSDIVSLLKAKRHWLDGVTITGGEPTLSPRLPYILRTIKGLGLKTKLDTNGTNPKALDELFMEGLLDAVYMDIKAPLVADEYSKVAGVKVNINLIKNSIEILKHSGIETVFRTTVIPGLVQETQLAAIRSGLGQISRYIVQPFCNRHAMSEEAKKFKEFSLARIEEMRAMFEEPRPGIIDFRKDDLFSRAG